jgi:integrase
MPKRVAALSARRLAATRATDKSVELIDGFLPGLRVRILPTGTRTWSLNIRDGKGVRRRFTVGSGLSLSEARRRGETLLRAVRSGIDPTEDRRAARRRSRAAQDGVGTFKALMTTYFQNGPGASQRRASKTKRLIETIFAEMLEIPVLDIDRPRLQLIADNWKSATSAALAVRTLRPCLKWAEKRGLVKPGVANLESSAPASRRDRVLTPEELMAIWPHFEGQHGQVFKWLLLTGCRLNEAAAMTWCEVDGDKWTIPEARAKNKRQRVVPLPRQATELLRSIGASDPHALVFPSQRGGVLSNWDRETKHLHMRSGTSGWHRHDLRRTVATMLGDLGIEPHVVGAVLGHAHIADGATAVYARSRYLREHRQALQRLADEFDRLVLGERKIIPFKSVTYQIRFSDSFRP